MFDPAEQMRKVLIACSPARLDSEHEEAEAMMDAKFADSMVCINCDTSVRVAGQTLRHKVGLKERGGCQEAYVIGWGLAEEEA